MKIKIINGVLSPSYDAPRSTKSKINEIEKATDAIEKEVNDFCKNKKVISITPSPFTTDFSVNGRSVFNCISYTIVYEEIDKK